MKVGDLPGDFMNLVMRAHSDYSVALARIRNEKAEHFTPLGSGVLVSKGSRFGILTARHCLHACSPEVELGPTGKDALLLVLRGQRTVRIEPDNAFEHNLVCPRSEEFGPDLTFVEIAPGGCLSSMKAVGSFWSLDRNSEELIKAFGIVGTSIVSIGFPQLDYKTTVVGNDVHHKLRHMSYVNAIGEGDVFERDGWDYIESTCFYPGEKDLPETFAGVSGGPVWASELRRRKSDGHISIEKSALVGITFYQTEHTGDQRRLRAHFIKSIYDLAWRGFR